MQIVANEAFDRHLLAYSDRECDSLVLRNPGYLHWRAGGEKHVNDPDSIAHLQVSHIFCFLVVKIFSSALNTLTATWYTGGTCTLVLDCHILAALITVSIFLPFSFRKPLARTTCLSTTSFWNTPCLASGPAP